MATSNPLEVGTPKQPVTPEVFLAAEQYNRGSSVKSSVIPAGGTLGISEYGNRFYFRNATSGVLVRSDQGVEKPYIKGQGENFAAIGKTFNRLEIRNPNLYSVYVQVWVGFGEYLDTTTELIELGAKYYPVVLPSQQIGASSYIILNGNPSGIQLQRKAILVTNDDLANSLVISDIDPITNLPLTAGNLVFAKTSVMIPVAGAIAISNNTAAAVVAYISELWYTYTN